MINYHHQNRLCYYILLTLVTPNQSLDYGSTLLRIGVLKKVKKLFEVLKFQFHTFYFLVIIDVSF